MDTRTKVVAVACLFGAACVGGSNLLSRVTSQTSTDTQDPVPAYARQPVQDLPDLAQSQDPDAQPDMAAAQFPFWCSYHGPDCLYPPGGQPMGTSGRPNAQGAICDNCWPAYQAAVAAAEAQADGLADAGTP